MHLTAANAAPQEPSLQDGKTNVQLTRDFIPGCYDTSLQDGNYVRPTTTTTTTTTTA